MHAGTLFARIPELPEGEIDRNIARFPLHITNADSIAIPPSYLGKQRQRIVIIDEIHRFPGIERVQCAKDRRMSKTLGYSACIE